MQQINNCRENGLKSLVEELSVVEKCIEVCTDTEVRECLYVAKENIVHKINEILEGW